MRKFFYSLPIFIAACMLSSESSAVPHSVLLNTGIQFGLLYSSFAPHSLNETRADELRREPGLQMEIQLEERPQERPLQVQKQRSLRDRQKMRRELIQRYERKQNFSPPAVRKADQHQIQQRKEHSRVTRSSRSAQERRSEDKSKRR